MNLIATMVLRSSVYYSVKINSDNPDIVLTIGLQQSAKLIVSLDILSF